MTQMYSPPTRSFTLPYDDDATTPRLERTLVDPDPPGSGLSPEQGSRSDFGPGPRPGPHPEPRSWLRPGTETASGSSLGSRFIARFGISRSRRFGFLGGWTVVWFLIFNVRGGYSWHYFTQGSILLFDGAASGSPAGGLHLYANYPQLQIGPFTFAVAQLLRQLGPSGGRLFAELVMTALGLVVLHLVERIALTVRPALASDPRLPRTLLYGGSAFVIGWVDLAAAYGHLDDVLALLCVTLAVWALISDLPAIAGICLGLSADAKPWALVFLPLILAVPNRIRRHAALWTAATIVCAWLPFVVADFHTLTVAQFTITNEPSSALRALGVTAPSTPWWDRAAQIALGCGLGALAVYRRRWPAVILLGVGARIALDPGVYGYYTAGVLLGALFWDLLGLRRTAPIWTIASGTALAVAPALITDTRLLGDLRLWLVLGFTVALLLMPSPSYSISDRHVGRSLRQ
jgi:hypothetical protein